VNVSKIFKDFRDHYNENVLNPSPPPIQIDLRHGYGNLFTEFLDMLDHDKRRAETGAVIRGVKRWAWYKGSALKELEEELLPNLPQPILEEPGLTMTELLDRFKLSQGLIMEDEEALAVSLAEGDHMALAATFTMDYENRHQFNTFPKFD
jgi:hypothetical protein